MDYKKIELAPLPYSFDALEPVISAEIMQLHHDKHHMAYVNGANSALEKLDKYQRGELEIDVKAIMRDFSFHYNGALMHDIFWKNMRPVVEDNKPTGELLELINQSFGSFEVFKKEFTSAAVAVEGSGWAVCWKTEFGLVIGQLEKHNLLAINNAKIILALDVWEHAYYLDYKNDRAKYCDSWWKVVNWDVVAQRV